MTTARAFSSRLADLLRNERVAFADFDHLRPRAMGGESTVENIRLLCRVHNLLAARQALGDRCMDRFTRVKRQQAAMAAVTADDIRRPRRAENAPPRLDLAPG